MCSTPASPSYNWTPPEFQLDPAAAGDSRSHICFTQVSGSHKSRQRHAMGCLLCWLASLASSEVAKLQPITLLIFLFIDSCWQVDVPLNFQSVRVFIKCCKTDLFRKGCFVFLGCSSSPPSSVVSLVITFTFVDRALDLYFFTRMVLLFLDPSSLRS